MSNLLETWAETRKHYAFARDGVLDADTWSRQSPKVAYLLKEPHSGWIPASGNIIIKGSQSKFWWNVVRWKFAVSQALNLGALHFWFPSPADIPEVNENDGKLNSIAYINIKKNDQDRKRSLHRDIRGYARSDSGFLRAQITQAIPDVLLCGGTFRFYRDIFPNEIVEKLGDRIYRHGSMIIIDFYHPGYWQFPGGQKGLFRRLNQVLGENGVLEAMRSTFESRNVAHKDQPNPSP
jgi:hypothetical protein